MSSQHDQGPAKDRRWNVLFIYLVTALTATSQGSLELVYPLNLAHLGHPLPLIGATVALIGLGSLVSRLPGGAWYRLNRARLLLSGALVVMGLSTVSLALGDQWGLQAVLGALRGFAFGLSTTFLLAVLIEVQPKGESAAPTMAWYTAALSTGFACGSPLGAQSIERFGYDGAFLTAGVVAFAGAGLTLALRRLPMEERPTSPARERTAGRSTIRLEWLAALPAGVWLATLLGFYINFVLDTYLTFFPIYAVSIGISLGAVGFLKSIHSLAATGIRFAAAGLFRFMETGVVNHVCVVVLALATVALSAITNEIALAVVFALLGTSRGLLRVTSATMVADEYKRSRASVGTASGVYNAGLDAGTMLGPPVAGALAGALDIPTTFRLVAVVLPLLYYIAWFAQRAYAPRSTPLGIE